MLRRELHEFLTALMFFTRIPCPSWVDHSPEILNRARKYFPLIGWIVGGLAALVFWLAALVLPLSVAVVLSTAAGIWVTGAFHEDGFADVCDGFGGGYSKEAILRIMKDSRVGAFGMLGMILLLLLKLAMLWELARMDVRLVVASLVSAHSLSRFVASTFVQTHDYVQDSDQSKVKPIANDKLSWGAMLYSGLWALLPLGLFVSPWALALIPVAFLPKAYLGSFFKRHIGGYTGDCLGAAQQVSEAVVYLGVYLVWTWMK